MGTLFVPDKYFPAKTTKYLIQLGLELVITDI